MSFSGWFILGCCFDNLPSFALLGQLGLGKVADNRIGSRVFKRGLSGGEQKRLAFASEVCKTKSRDGKENPWVFASSLP